MSTSTSVETYVRRLRRVEADTRPTPRAVLPPLELRWNQPVVDRQGHERWVLVAWQPWMPPLSYVMLLLDCIEDAAMGEPRGRSLDSLNRELAEILCRGPEGVDFMWRVIDEDSARRERVNQMREGQIR